jgi:hypothetical protein
VPPITTGISGITSLSPALSIARETGKLTYSYYMEGNYTIYSALPEEFNEVKVDPGSVDLQAATLPPFQRVAVNVVDRNMADNERYIKYPADSFRCSRYKPNFQLDYIGNTGVGIGFSTYYGTGMSGRGSNVFQ